MIKEQININMDEVWSNSYELLAVVDRQGILLMQNENWEHALGYTDGSLKMITVFDLVNQDDRQSLDEALADLFAGSPERSLACRLKSADNQYHLFQLNCRFLSDMILITGKDLIKNIMLQNLLLEAERNSSLIIRYQKLKDELADLQMRYDAFYIQPEE